MQAIKSQLTQIYAELVHSLRTQLQYSTHLSQVSQSEIVNSTTGLDSASCYVTGTTRERYDCCSEKSQNTCYAVSFIQFSLTLLLLIGFCLTLWKSSWLRNQLLMICVISGSIFFCFLRALYFSIFAYPQTQLETFFVIKGAPIIEFMLVLSALLAYMYYLQQRFLESEKIGYSVVEYKQKIDVMYLISLPLTILAYSCILIFCIAQGQMQPQDVVMTLILGLYFIGFLYVPTELYQTIKETMPKVAAYIKKYILALIILNEFQIFTRMIFISINDIAETSKINSQNDESDKWPGLILDHYKRVSTSDLNESVDNIYRLLKNLQDQLVEKEDQLQTIKEDLHLRKFEDSLFESICKTKRAQRRKLKIQAKVNQFNDQMEKADKQSIPQMDRLMKLLHEIRDSIGTEVEDRLHQVIEELQILENSWNLIQRFIKQDDEQISDYTQQNLATLQMNMIPLNQILANLKQIYDRILLNPFVNKVYFDKLTIIMSRDLQALDRIQKEVIDCYEGKLADHSPRELRKINEVVEKSLFFQQKIQVEEVNMLKDCNILFQFEAISSAIKNILDELKLNIDQEIASFKKTMAEYDENYQKVLIDLKVQIECEVIYKLDKEYENCILQKKDIDFYNMCPIIESFEVVMMKTLQAEQDSFNITNRYLQIKQIIDVNNKKLDLHSSLQASIKILQNEIHSNGYILLTKLNKFLVNYEEVIKSDDPQLKQLRIIHTTYQQTVLDQVRTQVAAISSDIIDVKPMKLNQVQERQNQFESLKTKYDQGTKKFSTDINLQVKVLINQIISIRKHIDLRPLRSQIQQLDGKISESVILKQQYEAFVLSAETILLQDLAHTTPQTDNDIVDHLTEVYNFKFRTQDILRNLSAFQDKLSNLRFEETHQKEYTRVYFDCFNMIMIYSELVDTIRKGTLRDLFFESSFGNKIEVFETIKSYAQKIKTVKYSDKNSIEYTQQLQTEFVAVAKEFDNYVYQNSMMDYIQSLNIKQIYAIDQQTLKDVNQFIQNIYEKHQMQEQDQELLNDYESSLEHLSAQFKLVKSSHGLLTQQIQQFRNNGQPEKIQIFIEDLIKVKAAVEQYVKSQLQYEGLINQCELLQQRIKELHETIMIQSYYFEQQSQETSKQDSDQQDYEDQQN
ncbi:UNKNOWN [Stylonychia lemnae]|uniref:Transmembrane protein n=1 Tax=Stylonychia lemnae TaxID=5949 RepID=A0A078A6K6_STYLE|nr:UNKNOWN [Stylonychia lemnae]|eukprot:CDW76369.1 UNKNOWN [Stylonychia lemnae]